MLILALDCCGSACSVCVWQDGSVVAQLNEAMERGQDARLMPMIVAAMKQAGHSFAMLDRIAVTRGPGSFTGARVGLAAARGIGLAAGKPVIGIDRFAIYHALSAKTDQNLLVVIASKRAELFCQFFPVTGDAHEATMLTETAIAAFVAAHPGTCVIHDKDISQSDAVKTCAQLAAQADAQNPAYAPRPLYLRAPDVTLPAANSR